uniref:Uncharacterized protein n=1 Tax=Oryza punctata TaxID=4537 RepID=A0A0E0KLY7_ORYPU
MDGGYTASASSRQMGKRELPLIQCLECELKTIVRRKAKTPENNGRIFYAPAQVTSGMVLDVIFGTGREIMSNI